MKKLKNEGCVLIEIKKEKVEILYLKDRSLIKISKENTMWLKREKKSNF